MVETRGHLEHVAIDETVLRLTGWAASLDAGPIIGFKLSCAGRELELEGLEVGLPSPDVQARYPRDRGSDHCRFRIRARLDPETTIRARSSVITCTPRFGGQDGQVLLHLIEPALPPPRPEEVPAVGGGAFLEVSSAFLGHLLQWAHLTPHSDVLDVGCGVGRIAYMLAHYLEPTATYEGFDITERMIAWPRRSITPRFPHFQFRKVDLHNTSYNPTGMLVASGFRFPYPSERFDLVLLISVFTHMRSGDVRHYLDECRRVLRPGGHCLTTGFLLNDESRALIRSGKSTLNLIHPVDEGFTSNPRVPEAAIGLDESRFLAWIADRGFTLRSRHDGSWCGRPRFLRYQDILVYQKTTA